MFTYGIELEGGWPISVALDGNGERKRGFVGDGSVNIRNQSGELYVGEWNSGVHDSPEQMLAAAEWPVEWNSSCGMHIHVGCQNSREAYCRFMSKKFFNEFVEEAEKWTDLIVDMQVKNLMRDRLRGENRYCTKEWRADMQVNQTGKTDCRYSILNFCWRIHNTMEIRVLPMMGKGDAQTVLPHLHDFIKKKATDRTRAVKIEMEIDEKPLVKSKYKV